MPSSGKGNSHDATYRECQQKYFLSYRKGLTLKGVDRSPPLVVGEGAHAYAQTIINAWLVGVRDLSTVLDDAMNTYVGVCGEWDPDDFKMNERNELACTVLPIWALRQWSRFQSGEETPIATELDLTLTLPMRTVWGDIPEHLATYTGRIDYVYRRKDGMVGVRDHKFTGASSPMEEAKHYFMSDQHLGYLYLWNHYVATTSASDEEYERDRASFVSYEFTRLHKNVTSASAWHLEDRNVDDAQMLSWFNRTVQLRADLARRWDMPSDSWMMNTAPHGPCIKFGRTCEYKELCERPSDRAMLEETKYAIV